jgi:hypothetical protein
MIYECAKDINCIVHDAEMPVPSYIYDIEFNLIVLGPTFLCNRYQPLYLAKVLEAYDFVRTSSACKVALPQDDYDCAEILDDWMVSWGVDRVYTVCPDNWHVLYPNYISFGDIRLGYTGYISDAWLSSWSKPKALLDRAIDVSYRATKLPANFGSLGYLKGAIAERFLNAVGSHSLIVDISTNPKDLIPGAMWHSFIENSKFCLATASGSSLLDSKGIIRQKVNDFALNNPNASFTEIERVCFPGEDNKYIFSAISPRNIEAALAGTIQIATQGTYSGLMKPMEHFIPIKDDCSDISLVIEMMADKTLVEKLRSNCKDSMLSEPRLRRSNMAREIVDFAKDICQLKNLPITNSLKTRDLFKRYKADAAFYLRKKRLRQTLSEFKHAFSNPLTLFPHAKQYINRRTKR